MKNKKGVEMGELLKIVLSVFAIVILLGLAYSLYKITQAKEKDQAEAVLKQVADKINTMNQGQEIMTITGPRGWYLFNEEKFLCICDAIKAECSMQNKTCVSLPEEISVAIPEQQISIYVSDIILEKENEKVFISTKK